ncbi:MAG: LysR substrate-binding domain-containing protein [Pseudomonadota bacterium]
MKLLRFRDLEYFIAIAEHGSFSRAAESCGISQPTLSAQVRRMEELLGITLVERRHGAATVTAEGGEVLAAAREIMDSFYRVQRTTAGDGILLGRPLRFGVLPTVAPYFAARFLNTLTDLNADADIDFVEDRTDALELAVNADTLDFAITATLPRVQTLVAIPLAEERLVAVSNSPLAPTIEIDELKGPVLLMQEGNCFREVVSEAIRRAKSREGSVVSTRIGPSSFATLLSLVRSGMGDTILPEPYVRENATSLAGLHTAVVEPSAEGRQLQLVVRRGRERYRDVQRLVEAATDALTKINAAAAAA